MDRRSFFYIIVFSLVLFGVNWYFEGENQKAAKAWQEQQKLLKDKALKATEEETKPQALQQVHTGGQKPKETFWVLENGVQQLVFSNWGGALAEINLPFQNETNGSVVKEIAFDRDMIEQEPQNAYFPSRPYKTADGREHPQGKLGGYYPLIRRDLIQKSEKKSIALPPRFYALNIVSDYPEVAELVYEAKEFREGKIVFEASQPFRKITKTFTLAEDYVINLDIEIEGDTRGLWLTTGIPEVEWISGGPAPALKYRMTRGNKAEVETIDLPKETLTLTSTAPDWIVNSNGFLGVILDPYNQKTEGLKAQFVSGTTVPSRLIEIDEKYHLYPAEKMPGYNLMLPVKGAKSSFRIFAGPFATATLKKIDTAYSDPSIGYNPDYLASQTFHGWFAFISEPFAKFLLILMRFFYWLSGSWALSIVLLTVALRVMLYPLNAWSLKSTMKMQKIAPEIAKIQEKHKKDPKKAQLEIVKLYRDAGVNPVSGCFPLLIQMPFLIGMFDLLKSTFELRGASFIPGWIDDLAAPDVLFSWEYPILFIGNAFHLLPFILGGVMFLQQRLMSAVPTDPKLMTDQQRQSRAMGTMMAFLFTFLFYHFPSGLNLYWLSSMLLGILQQWWTNRK
jgi:YidC/Oxa1 family membrane protein insertase